VQEHGTGSFEYNIFELTGVGLRAEKIPVDFNGFMRYGV
jgi:hypothetical protein